MGLMGLIGTMGLVSLIVPISPISPIRAAPMGRSRIDGKIINTRRGLANLRRIRERSPSLPASSQSEQARTGCAPRGGNPN